MELVAIGLALLIFYGLMLPVILYIEDLRRELKKTEMDLEYHKSLVDRYENEKNSRN